MKGAFVLETAVAHINAVAHVAVVDPGVGGEGNALLLQTRRGDCLLGPDNGILIPAARRLGGIAKAFIIHTKDIPSGSTFGCGTFHARDVYAPAAVRLAKGEPPEEIGERCDSCVLAHAPFQSAIVGPGNIDGAIIDVDRFGTLRINARREDAEKAGFVPGAIARVSFIGGEYSVKMVKTFSDTRQGGEILLYDSSDYLCLGLNGAHAGLAFGLKAGDTILLELTVK
jgi:hypothetical protein